MGRGDGSAEDLSSFLVLVLKSNVSLVAVIMPLIPGEVSLIYTASSRQPGLQSETLSQSKKKQNNNNKLKTNKGAVMLLF